MLPSGRNTTPLLGKARPELIYKQVLLYVAVILLLFGMPLSKLLTLSDRSKEVTRSLSRFKGIMPTPYSRYKRQNKQYLVNVKSGRCLACNKAYKKCNLRITFKEFEQLVLARKRLSESVEEVEADLETVEEALERAQERVQKARRKARRVRKELRFTESKEDDLY